MSISLDIQMACPSEEAPEEDSMQRWASAALRDERDNAELSVRIVDEQESATLNQQYRGKAGSTNILSFPFDAVTPEPLPILGDLVICAPVVVREAAEQNKSLEAHWAHMCVHGVLHLLGYDHVGDRDAEVMETLETDILLGLGYPAPYSFSDSSEQ
ncbi:rRNA maturation RNase YbeY [Porticoccaceae bacterium]|jgi:probable rRNA maturation factor|nr:rRNA maturation RNase YbeY [Porticoccaceae bacterium]MBT6319973.1 rRNA maturation RNase YbeY [Porticoccaceae bacterium]MBT7257954.1 rRNA maturation RNase YbeY [Porticoccaceae bacterium]MBT7904210.1 rRNA maturation RNase YbeY [Porticoccaceae bacterium]MDA7815403.1 rRNA maturation RNase YbeY [Porticoccaceae bacterium]